MLFDAACHAEHLASGGYGLPMEAGMNTVRIAESTGATDEPREGDFDFSPVKRVLGKAIE